MTVEADKSQVEVAIQRLMTMAASPTCTAEMLAHEARAIAADWWLDVQAGAGPTCGLAALAGDLRCLCLWAVEDLTRLLDGQERAGLALEAESTRWQAAALCGAAAELSRYEKE